MGDVYYAKEKKPSFTSSHGTLRSYVTGFLLSVLITFVAFFIVGWDVMSPLHTRMIVILLALVQLVVQSYFFLHLNSRPGSRWSVMTFLFAALCVFIIVIGSIWIMDNLNTDMGKTWNVHYPDAHTS